MSKAEWESLDDPIVVEIDKNLYPVVHSRRKTKDDGTVLETELLGGDRLQIGLRSLEGKLVKRMTITVGDVCSVVGFQLDEAEGLNPKDKQQREELKGVLQRVLLEMLT